MDHQDAAGGDDHSAEKADGFNAPAFAIPSANFLSSDNHFAWVRL
jgi:hypothetical protein